VKTVDNFSLNIKRKKGAKNESQRFSVRLIAIFFATPFMGRPEILILMKIPIRSLAIYPFAFSESSTSVSTI